MTDVDQQAVESIFDLYWSDDFRGRLSERRRSESAELRWLVADEGGEVVGVAAFRAAPDRMKQYATAEPVAEFYVAAAKYKGKGIGTGLYKKVIEETKNLGYAQIVFFSGESHKDSWAVHDKSDFKRISPAVAPNGEAGYIWRMDLR